MSAFEVVPEQDEASSELSSTTSGQINTTSLVALSLDEVLRLMLHCKLSPSSIVAIKEQRINGSLTIHMLKLHT